MGATPLPVGQRRRRDFPRFGLTPFANRFPDHAEEIGIRICGEVEREVGLEDLLPRVRRTKQVSDFHCVTSWSCTDLVWEGYLLADVLEEIDRVAGIGEAARIVIVTCQDGYATSLPLEDLRGGDVLLADRLNGVPLTVEHGAPLRLVAPAHYGYKNAKHVAKLKFVREQSDFRPPGLGFLVHPRGRVALEERGSGVPGWILRYLYRPLIAPNAFLFRRAMRNHDTRRSHGASSGGDVGDKNTDLSAGQQ
jgi:DMSO/TMAO reductase YedYZ molybdopterin-dependent catalytic subunit